MVLVIAGMFIAYLVTFFLMPFIIKIAKINKLFDLPDERKTHTYPVSSLGGTGIVAGLSISILLVSDFTFGDSEFQYYLATFFIIFILGIIDDIFVLKAWKKAIGQIFVTIILTAKAHLLINNLQGLGGINAIDPLFSYPITFFSIILVINSFNLIDGVDGLAASVGLVSCVFFGLFFYINNMIPYAILGFATAGSLLAFLMFNFPPAKIFMGDSGSMLIGLVNAILLIKFIDIGNTATNFPVNSSLAIGFGILLIPLLDVLRVFIIRSTKGVSPFKPDRNHLHHLLLNKGFSHVKVTISLSLAACFFAFTAFLLESLNVNLIAFLLILQFFASVFIIKFFLPAQKLQVVGIANRVETNSTNTKILSLYKKADETITANNE